ncbi:Uncharacterised protein [Mycobacterium tuberculosis]|uniref:Uncharacterized protein n=1 Tax=Mycobacterium tuberculosis TaxID=1773 RepID=A0A654TU01_MYCTX|nr:Uncharacterised protein [Mycobacterium tuberculosis]CFE81008.1 Uncharacterised protein [Mycobacterium tuberculosis]CKT61666.1 Uncharacterised protein [Mycobacterium tuberculosis]CNU24160.1 Uncharacterised protein [Mycobacterium tuberculosis]CNV87320.1 Uncharacterised protein [Mycobacterium tuberculosis]
MAGPSAGLRTAVRCQHHRHVASVLLGGRLDESVIGDVRTQPLQQSIAQLRPRLLTSTEHNGDLDLRSRLQEADDVTLFGLVIVIVNLWSQLLFFDDGLLLVSAGFARLLRGLVLVLAVVHDLADRRSGIGSNFDKVEICVRGDAKCVFDTHNAYLLPPWADQSDFRYADALVDAGFSADGASLVGCCSRRDQLVGPGRNQVGNTPKPSAKKALHKQGPMPTDRGQSRPRCTQNRHPRCL